MDLTTMANLLYVWEAKKGRKMAFGHENASHEFGKRALAIRHSCGHEHVHAVPQAFVQEGVPALALADTLAAHDCPACAAGLPRWMADPSGARATDAQAPGC
ncbi:hypothetical protein emb_1d0089 [Coriobacteriaceae bacterium EMTCatB1]|nr:hypothetical protein [Anaerosomatales bacterium]GAV30808.1 hypothetical protein emb_1d0089 [Coriobacteriaceae bacterium EMTCatB1]